jgi:hypothetical protein
MKDMFLFSNMHIISNSVSWKKTIFITCTTVILYSISCYLYMKVCKKFRRTQTTVMMEKYLPNTSWADTNNVSRQWLAMLQACTNGVIIGKLLPSLFPNLNVTRIRRVDSNGISRPCTVYTGVKTERSQQFRIRDWCYKSTQHRTFPPS